MGQCFFLTLLQIEFSLDENVIPGTPEYNLLRRMRFWEDSARPWLLERGYTLYNHPVLDEEVTDFANALPLLRNATQFGGEFPYAFHDDILGKHSSEDPFLNMTYVRTPILSCFSLKKSLGTRRFRTR